MKRKKKARTGRGYAVAPNILRVDYARTHGFRVTFNRTNAKGKKKATTKSFGDGRFGGDRTKAYRAALEWRNATEKLLPPKRKAGSGGDLKPPGYSYVKKMPVFVYDKKTGERSSYMAYVGFIRLEDQKNKGTKWSIPKWGDREAKRRCEAWEARQQAQLRERLRLARKKSKGKKKR